MFLKIQLLKNTLEEVSNKAERKVKGKSKEKGNGKEKGKGKDKGKSKKKKKKYRKKNKSRRKLILLGKKTSSIYKRAMYFES